MIVRAFDPGPTTCGVVDFDTETRRVVWAAKDLPTEAAIACILPLCSGHIAIERIQAQGIAGNSVIATTEVVGRLWQRSVDQGVPVSLHRRRAVLRHLDVAGRGNRDSLVRARLIEVLADGDAKAAKGTKKNPGPLYGVSGHAWAALAVAITAAESLSL